MNTYSVQVVKLREDESVDRQIFAHTSHLTEGTRVRLMVGEVPAWMVVHADWYRTDLVWQFETEHPTLLIGWQQLLARLEAKWES